MCSYSTYYTMLYARCSIAICGYVVYSHTSMTYVTQYRAITDRGDRSPSSVQMQWFWSSYSTKPPGRTLAWGEKHAIHTELA